MRLREGREPSLFEIIENRLQGPTLQDRFITVLSQLRRKDPLLRDLLIVLGYVDACRTPMSMDMLIAFLRGDVKDYKQIHLMMRNLGSMVSEYVDVSLEDQDYYVTRSVIVGEAILKAVDGPTLGSVLWRFHDRLSPLRISNYETFQRYAFDDKITGKAYPKWQDGVAFYDMVYAKNESYPNSYYILQQSALYCAKKHQKLEAFKRIDKAVTLSGRRKWSIRNSQAYILFEANIGLEPTREVRDSLRQSMQILQECYKWDGRKTYHATTFADQALRLRSVLDEDEVETYLVQAREWLRDESIRTPWARYVRNLRPKVQDALVALGHPSSAM